LAREAVSLLHQGNGKTSEDLEGDKPPQLQTKTLRATGFFKSVSSSCQFVCIEHRMSMLILCTMLVSLFRPGVLLSVLPTSKPIRRGLLACLPATLVILTDPLFSFLVKGLFFPSGPFSLIDVRSFLLLA